MRWLFICLSVCKIELLRQAIYDSTVMFFILVCVYLKTVSLCAFPAILFIYLFFLESLCIVSVPRWQISGYVTMSEIDHIVLDI